MLDDYSILTFERQPDDRDGNLSPHGRRAHSSRQLASEYYGAHRRNGEYMLLYYCIREIITLGPASINGLSEPMRHPTPASRFYWSQLVRHCSTAVAVVVETLDRTHLDGH
jgi:hypothetical protein